MLWLRCSEMALHDGFTSKTLAPFIERRMLFPAISSNRDMILIHVRFAFHASKSSSV